MKANHNCVTHALEWIESVCNLSKNTIWKQITTPITLCWIQIPLYAIYQRTQYESKSQLIAPLSIATPVCMQSIKEHNMKANHNETTINIVGSQSVCNLSKNTIWKQITTVLLPFIDHGLLYAIYQRTQYESKSQPYNNRSGQQRICMQSIKEHNMKANHNYHSRPNSDRFSVCNLSKNTIWKQITTVDSNRRKSYRLYAIYQRTQYESKSQLQHKQGGGNLLYAIYPCLTAPRRQERTQYESKSQLSRACYNGRQLCMQSIKEHSR